MFEPSREELIAWMNKWADLAGAKMNASTVRDKRIMWEQERHRAETVVRLLTADAKRKMDDSRTLPVDRDTLGRHVRGAWIRWALKQVNTKPSWLIPYDDLDEAYREADRQIGETIARWTLIYDAARAAGTPLAKDPFDVEGGLING